MNDHHETWKIYIIQFYLKYIHGKGFGEKFFHEKGFHLIQIVLPLEKNKGGSEI